MFELAAGAVKDNRTKVGFFLLDCLTDRKGFYTLSHSGYLKLSHSFLPLFPSNSSYQKEAAFPPRLVGKCPILECLQNFIVALSLYHTCRYKAAAILTSVSSAVCCVLSCPAGI